jgi:hypothetical protein
MSRFGGQGLTQVSAAPVEGQPGVRRNRKPANRVARNRVRHAGLVYRIGRYPVLPSARIRRLVIRPKGLGCGKGT